MRSLFRLRIASWREGQTGKRGLTQTPYDVGALRNRGGFLRPWLTCLALTGVLFVAGCSAYRSEWVEAPLLTDGHTERNTYTGFGDEISISETSSANFKFSLFTLPGAKTLVIKNENGRKTVSSADYQLTPAKVKSARLVVYVETLVKPGYVLIKQHRSLADQQVPHLCVWHEATAPACPAKISAEQFDGVDPDPHRAGQPVLVNERGFYSFDVTNAVKSSIQAKQSEVMLSMSSIDGDFRIASKDKRPPARVERGAQLLITLSDVIGSTDLTPRSNSLREDAPDQNFSSAPTLPVRGDAPHRSVGLVNHSVLPGSYTLALQNAIVLGGAKVQMSLVSRINAPLPNSATTDGAAPALSLLSFGDFNGAAATWNNTTQPSPSSALPYTSLDANPFILNQVTLADATAAFANLYASTEKSNLWFGIATNAKAGITLNGGYTAGAPFPNRLIIAISDPGIYPRRFDQTKHEIYAFTGDSDRPDTWVRTNQLSARAGQRFRGFYIGIEATGPTNNKFYAEMPLSFVVPPSDSASASLNPTDVHVDDFQLMGSQGMSGHDGVAAFKIATANRVAGTYPVVVSMAGHNDRLRLNFTNLPLPVPTLSGPSIITIPLNDTSVTVSAGAAAPFTLKVDDALVNAHIDDTTKWRITSSNAADTAPGLIQQTHGSTSFAMTFASPGARTITVTSVGDAAVTATLDVEVTTSYVVTGSANPKTAGTLTCPATPVTSGQTAQCFVFVNPGYTLSSASSTCDGSLSGNTFTTGPVTAACTVTAQFLANQTITNFAAAPTSPVYAPGGSFTVSATGGGSGNPVTFTSSSPSCTVSVGGSTVSIVSAGTCNLTANQAGNASYTAATPVQLPVTIAKAPQTLTFGTQTPASREFSPGGKFIISPLATSPTPNSGQAIIYSSGEAAVCTVSGTEVTMVSAGTCTIVANQPGNNNYEAATQVSRNVAIGVAPQKLTFPAQTPASHVYAKDKSFAITPVATSSHPDPARPVTYSSLSEKVCTVSGTTVKVVGAGTCTLAADQVGDANHAAADQATQEVTIAKPPQTLTFEAQTPDSHVFVKNTQFAIHPQARSAEPHSGESITYSSLTTDICTVTDMQVTMVGPGACVIAADQAGDANYEAAVQVKQTVALNAQKNFSGTTVPTDPAKAGAATATFTGGGDTCRFDPEGTSFIAAPTPPTGKTLPQGMFQFKLVGCDETPVAMNVTWPEPVTGYIKYGKETKEATASTYFAPNDLNISDKTVSFTVVDGQKGDDDWTLNGDIVDPNGPMADAAAPAQVTAVPTLGEWSLMLLGLLAAGLGARRLRRSVE